MQEVSSRSRLFFTLLCSLALHGFAALWLLQETPKIAKPLPPFARAALQRLVFVSFSTLRESENLLCASFPWLCEEARFVELDLSIAPEENTPPPPPELLAKAPEIKPIDTKLEPPKPPEPPPTPALEVPPPPPVILPPERKKSVEQIVEKEDALNPNAQFLAEKTKIVEEQTQAKVTSNHIMDKEAVAPPEDNNNEEENAGNEEKKIAGVENKEAAPSENKNPIHKENEAPPAEQGAPKGSEKEGKQGDPIQLATVEGLGEKAISKETERGNQGKGDDGKGKGATSSEGKTGKPRLTLSMNDYEKLYGKTEGAAKGQQDEISSSKGGKGEKRKKFVMAQLENYLPEVKTGNQTALSTAADPFAKFLQQFHLRLHEKWGDGTLRDFDKLGGTNLLNDPNLQITLEISVLPDGTLDKAAPIGSSGYLPFDVAAVTAVYDAGPFPQPPENIRSYNGKVYLRWTLHRDARQCATSFAEPYILTGPSASSPPSMVNQ